MFSARYSSGSSGLAPAYSPSPAIELRVVLFETVRDVLEEDEAQDDVLVFRRVHVAAQLVSASHSFCSKPMLAELLEDEFLDFLRAICEARP